MSTNQLDRLEYAVPTDQSQPMGLDHTRTANLVRSILDRESWTALASNTGCAQENLMLAPNLKLVHLHNLRQDSHFITVLVRVAGGQWFDATDDAGPWHSFLADELYAAANGAALQPELSRPTLEQMKRDWTPC